MAAETDKKQEREEQPAEPLPEPLRAPLGPKLREALAKHLLTKPRAEEDEDRGRGID